MLFPPTGWLESVSGEEQWLLCRCSESISHCANLLLQTVCGSACAKTIKSLLCPKHSRLDKAVLAPHETHMHSTLFYSVLAPPFLDIVPWCWLLPMLVWLQDLLHLAEPLQMRTGSFCKAHTPILLSLSPLACLTLKSFHISMDAVSPRQCNDITCYSLGFPKCAQKAALCAALCRKTHIAFLEPYWSITPVLIWLITILDTVALICAYL